MPDANEMPLPAFTDRGIYFSSASTTWMRSMAVRSEVTLALRASAVTDP